MVVNGFANSNIFPFEPTLLIVCNDEELDQNRIMKAIPFKKLAIRCFKVNHVLELTKTIYRDL